MNRRWSVCAVMLVLLVTLFSAQACGPDFSDDIFVNPLHPNKPAEFAAGRLGVVLPTYPRADLMVVFRYLQGGSLNQEEQKAYQPTYKYSDPEWGKQWDAQRAVEGKEPDPVEQWRRAREQYAAPATKADTNASGERQQADGSTQYSDYSNCNSNAFATAIQTLQARATSWGAKSAELADWLEGQDAVFANCPGKMLVLPDAAPSNSPALLKADRAYQKAAALFYAGHYEAAREAFAAIHQDTTSPWQGIAGYLEARALIRDAFDVPANNGAAMAQFDSDPMQQAATLLQALLREKHPGISQSAIEDMLDLARLRSEPEKQVHRLSVALAGPQHDARYKQHLLDLTWYLNARLDELDVRQDSGAYSGEPVNFSKAYNGLASLRATSTPVDWLISFQSPCEEAKRHATAEWKKRHTLDWLLAAISKVTGKDAEAAELIAAAEAVKADAPAWETITYHRLRLMIALGKAQEARALLETFCDDKDYSGVVKGSTKSLKDCLLGLRVRDLMGYTEEKLMAFVESKGGPDGKIPAFLEQQLSNGRTLASYLKGADQGN